MIYFFVFLGRGEGIGIRVKYSGMVDRFVRSDLVYYQLGDCGCTSLLVLFSYKGYIF